MSTRLRKYSGSAASISLAALFLSAPSLIQPALAQQQVASAAPEFVTVTATRGTAQQNLDVSSTILSSADVLQAPEISIDQIVNKIPGIFTPQTLGTQLHPTGQPFSIRGFGTSTNINTLLLIDGIPANDAFFRTVDWAQVPRNSIQSLQVIRGGGASSSWGNLAMGGIVDIVTKQPSEGMNFDLSGGSFGTFNGQASGGADLGGGLVVGADVGFVTTDGYNPTPRQFRNPHMINTSSQTENYRVSSVYTPSSDLAFYISATHHRIGEHGLGYDIARNNWQTDRIAGGGAYNLSDTDSLNFTGWYGQGQMFTQNASNTSYTIFNPLAGTPFVSQTEKVTYHHVGGSVFFKGEWGDLKDINIGADTRDIWAHDPLNVFAATGQIGQLVANAKHQFQGLFAQAIWKPEAIPLQVTGGVREDFWQAVDGAISGNFRGSPIGSAVPDQNYDHFSPRLGVKYFLPEGFDVRGAVYSNFAAPGMNQMYRSFISGTNYATFNANLKPQTNFGREIGIDWNGEKAHVSFTLYDNSLRRFIDFATVQSGCAAGNNFCGTGITAIGGGQLRQYVNAGNATLKGAELMGDWTILDGLTLNGGVAVTDAYLTSSNFTTPSAGVIPDPVRQQLGQVPRWTITGGVDWQVTEALVVSLTGKSFPGYWNNTSHTQFNSAATLFDLGASYRVKDDLQLYIVAQNIFGRSYYDQGLAFTTTNGSTISGGTTPSLGIPFNVIAGVRFSL
jgi:outer membrane receptor protein involved in Fe transport